MKKFIFIIAAILIYIIIYLGGAFVQANFDITKWSEVSRFMVGFWSTVVMTIGVVVQITVNKDDEDTRR